MRFSHQSSTILASCLLLGIASAQTYTSCNPLTQSGCKADTALGKSINVDFTKGAVNSFTASGNPTYSSNGVSFTVAKGGDAPQLSSLFYIMFGKVSITMKAAPGAGIVSSLVLESDDLDEIDMEWLGADDTQVQTNYFGKGDVTTYNRGAYSAAPNNQGTFITYTIEWTATQITWSVAGQVVRVLTPATADTNQYPQTPMQVKFGSWSGGDSANNPPGTVAWARGPTNFAAGPFTMLVQSISIADYSTGTTYSYGDQSGTWQSIVAAGGKVNGNSGSNSPAVPVVGGASPTSASPSVPVVMGGSSTETGWPWVTSATTLQTAAAASTSIAGIPAGWTVSGSGKIVPASTAAAVSYPVSSSLSVPSPSLSSPPSAVTGVETSVGWDDRGFPTTRTIFLDSATTSPVPINNAAVQSISSQIISTAPIIVTSSTPITALVSSVTTFTTLPPLTTSTLTSMVQSTGTLTTSTTQSTTTAASISSQSSTLRQTITAPSSTVSVAPAMFTGASVTAHGGSPGLLRLVCWAASLSAGAFFFF